MPRRFVKPYNVGCQKVEEGTLEALYLGDFEKYENSQNDQERLLALKLMSQSEAELEKKIYIYIIF